MRRSLLLLWSVVSLLSLGAQKPMPEKKALDAAKRVVAERFADDIRRRRVPEVIKIMLDVAADTDDDARQAATYLAAIDLAADVGNLSLAFRAVDEMEYSFELDAPRMKANCIETTFKNVRTADIRAAAVRQSLTLMSEALAVGRFDVFEQVAKAAQAAANRVRDPALRREFAAKRRELDQTRKTYESLGKALADAQTKLAVQPDDGAANELVGKHLAVEQSDWPQALAHLAKAADAELRAAALADAKEPDEPSDQVAIADAWWNIADGLDADHERAAFRARAGVWYTRALAGIKGVALARARRRVKEAGEARRTVLIPWQILVRSRRRVTDDGEPAPAAGAARATTSRPAKPVEVAIAPDVAIKLVRIAGNSEKKTGTFWLGETEVTQRQWKALMASNPSVQTKSDDLPVHNIGFEDAQAYVQQLNRLKTRFKFRLPTKEEWFYALEAGDPKTAASLCWPASDAFAWTKENAGGSYDYHPVASKQPNAWGLFDMQGNCWEWAADGLTYGMCSFDDCTPAQVERFIARHEPFGVVQKEHWAGITLRVAADAK